MRNFCLAFGNCFSPFTKIRRNFFHHPLPRSILRLAYPKTDVNHKWQDHADSILLPLKFNDTSLSSSTATAKSHLLQMTTAEFLSLHQDQLQLSGELQQALLLTQSTPQSVADCSIRLEQWETKQNSVPEGSLNFMLCIDSAQLLLDLPEVLRTTKRCLGVILDLNEGKEEEEEERRELVTGMATCKFVTIAKAFGLPAFFGPSYHLDSYHKYWLECKNLKTMGMAGRVTISGDQTIIANSVFGITQKEAAEAEWILCSAGLARKRDGLMEEAEKVLVGPPHITKAKKILEKYNMQIKPHCPASYHPSHKLRAVEPNWHLDNNTPLVLLSPLSHKLAWAETYGLAGKQVPLGFLAGVLMEAVRYVCTHHPPVLTAF
jgi:citrate lyase beta subunit